MVGGKTTFLSGATIALGLTLALLGQSASATVYTWSPGAVTGGTDASGLWSTANPNWWNGSSDVNWTATGLDTAVFGSGHAGSFTVTASGGNVNVGAIVFNAGSNYTISGTSSIYVGGNSAQYYLGSGANGTGASGIYDNATGVVTTIANSIIETIGPQTWSAPAGGTLQITSAIGNDFYSGNPSAGMGNITIAGSGVVSIASAATTSMQVYANVNAMSGTLSLSEPWAQGNGYGWGVLVGPNATVNLRNSTAGFAALTYPADGMLDGYGIINVNNTGSGISGGWVSLYNSHSQGEAANFLPQMIFTGTLNINSGVFSTNGSPAEVLGSATVNISANGVMAMHEATAGWTIGSLNGAGAVAPTQLGNATYTLTVGAGNLSGSFSGIIHGNDTTGGTDGTIEAGFIALTKIGAGTQTLTGSNTYTGLTNIAGGELLLNFAAGNAPASNILFNNSGTLGVVSLNGGILGVNAGGSAKSQTLSSINVGAGGLNISNAGGNMTLTAGSLNLVAGGMMTINLATGAGSNTFTVTNTTGLNAGTNGWLAVTDATGTGFGMLSGNNIVRNTTTTPLTMTSNNAGTDFTTTPTDPDYSSGTLTLGGGAGAANSLAINAASTGVIDLGGNTLSLSSNGLLMYGPGSYTIQDGQLGASGAGVVVNQIGSGTLTIASPISGGGGTFAVGGGGAVYLTGTSTYSGGTYIGNGLLNISSSSAIGTGSIVFNGNGTLQAGADGISLNNAISTPNSAVSATFDTQSFSTTASGLISGPGGLVKVGNGTLTLSNVANTYSGGTTINGGVLSVPVLSTSGGATQNGTASSLGVGMSITFNGGTLLYTGAATGGLDGTAYDGANNNYSVTLLSGGGTLECPNGAITLTMNLAGSGNLTIANPGLGAPSIATMLAHPVAYSSQYRNSSVDFTGNIIVGNNGVLEIRQDGPNQLGNPASIQINPAGIFMAETDATLNTAGDEPISFNAPLVLNGGTLGNGNLLAADPMTYYGPVTANSGTTSWVGTVNKEIGAMILAGNLLGSGTLVTTGTGGITSTNSITLAGSNAGFSGAFLSTAGATIFATPNAGSPNATWVANGQGFIASMGSANFGTAATISLGALQGSTGTLNNAAGNTTATFSVGALNTTTTFGGVIQNAAGTTALLKIGTGGLTLTGNNTYNGATTVSGGGTLSFMGNSVISGNNAIMVQTGMLNISSGSFNTGTNGFYVGTTGVGTVNMSGGSIGFTGDNLQFLIGNGNNGTFNLNGGVVTGNATSIASRGVILGVNGGSAVNPVLATFNVSNGYLNMPSSELAIGRNDSGQSYTTDTYSQTGGTAVFQNLSVGGPATATSDIASLSVTSGIFSATTFQNLSSGSVSSASIFIGGNAQVTLPPFPGNVGLTSTATLTMNGGTLTTNASSANYFNGATFVYAGSNGANLNVPSGQSVTVSQGIQDLSGQFGALSVRGNGTLTLNGSNAYSGPTTVSGNLLLDFTAANAPISNIINFVSNNSSLTLGGGALTVQGSAGASNSQQFNGFTANPGLSAITVNSGAGGTASLSLGPIASAGGVLNFTLPASGSISTTTPDGVLPWATVGPSTFAAVSGGVIVAATTANFTATVPVMSGVIPSGAATSVAIVDGGSPGNMTLGSSSTIVSALLQSASLSAGTIAMSGGSLQATGIMIPSGAQALTIGVSPGDGTLSTATAGGALALYNFSSNILTINSAIADNTSASPLYAIGPGATVLNAANTYTGATFISGGSLTVTGTSSLGNGAYAASIANNGSLIFSTSTTQTLSGAISGSGSLAALGPGNLTLGNSTSTYAGGTTISGCAITAGALSANSAASSLGVGTNLTFNGGLLNLTGPATGNANLTSNAAGNDYAITLLSGGGTINLTAGSVTFSGSLSGSGNLTIENLADTAGTPGAQQVFFATLTDFASPNFTGNIIIGQGGALQLRSSAASLFGNAASVIINTGGLLQADKNTGTGTLPSTLSTPIVLSGGTMQTQGASMNYTGPATVSSGFTSYIGSSGAGTQTLSGNLSGSGTVSTIGAVAVTLSGANNSGFNGTWEATTAATSFANAGAGSSNALWVANGQGFTANIAGGGTINMGALSGTTGTLSNLAAATLSTFSVGTLGNNTTYGGAVVNGSGTLGLAFVGPGVFTLSGSLNSYTGPTTITGGTLQEILTPTPTWPSAAVTGSAGAALAISYPNASQVYSIPVSGGINLITAGTGTLTLAANPSYTGSTIVTAGTLKLTPPSISVSGFGSSTSGSAASQNNLTWQFNSSGSSLNATPVTSNVLTLTDNHGSESRSAWDLTQVSPVNGFTANFTYSPSSGSATADGMTFVLQNAGTGALGSGGGLFGYVGVNPSVGIVLNLFSNVSQSYYVTNGGTLAGEVLASSTSAFFHSGVAISVSVSYNAQEQLMAWTMSNSLGSFSDSQSGVNMGSILGSSTALIGFTGATGGATATQTISNFTYTPVAATTLPSGTPLMLAAGAAFDLSGQSQTLGSLSGGGTVTNSFGLTPLLTVGTDNTSQTFSGILQNGLGVLSVTKTGAGMWTLAGNNTYSGNTTLSGGTLQLGNGGSTGSIGSGGFTINNSWLSFNRNDAGQIFPYSITSGTVSQDGAGTTTLAANNTYSGGTFINQGYLAVGNGGNTGTLGSGPIAIANNANLIFSRSDAFFTVANTISGAGNVYQNGSGTVSLTGLTSYTGSTTVTNGNLYINTANATSAIAVYPGATLGGTGTASVATATLYDTASLEAGTSGSGSLTLAGLNFQTVSFNNVNVTNIAQYGTNAAINVTGTNGLSANGSASSIAINLYGPAITNTTPQTAHLIQYSGSIQGTGTSVFTLNPTGIAGYGQRSDISLNTSTPGYINVVYFADYPIWTGSGDSTWFTSQSVTATGTTNWALAATPSTQTNFVRNDSVVFNDSAVSTIVNITDSGGVYPSLVTFNNNALSYTLTGNYGIQGGGALIMNGSGTVSIYTNNGYYGGTTINAGRLNIGNTEALGSASNGAFFIINGGLIDNVSGSPLTTDNYPITWNGGFTFVGTNPLNLGSGGMTLGTSSAAVNVSGSTLEIDSVIGDNSQGFGFTQSGAGLLILTASNTYLGPTVVNGGTLEVGNGGSGAYIGTTSGVSLAANALLLFNLSDAQTYATTISGSGGVMQFGSGFLTLATSNTYTGGTTVNGGTLELNAGGPTGTLAPGSTVTVNSGAELLLNASNALGTNASYTNLSVNSGGLVFANSGYRVPLFGTVNVTGGTLASAAGNGDGNGNYSLGATLNATSDALGNPAVISATQVSLVANTVLNVSRGSATAADLIVNSVISSFPGGNGLTVQGNGITQFAGANTYNGGTMLTSGTLQLAASNATLGASSGSLTVIAGALLDINGVNTSVGGLNGGGTIDNVAGALGVSPTFSIGNGNAGGTFSGTIQNNSGATTLVKAGNGTQVLSGTNTYTGGTNVNGGVLNFVPSALPFTTSPPNISFGGGALQWATGNTEDVSAGIGPIPSGKLAGIDTNGNNVTFNTGLSGAGGVNKLGAGMLTFAVANAYSGTTSITGGTLNLADPLAVQNSTVSVGAAAVLSFSAGITSPTLGGLAGSGNLALITSASEAVTLNVGNNNLSTSYFGVLNNAGGLTKIGTGALTLFAPETYSGATNLSGGTLRIKGSGNLPSSTPLTISNSGTFDMTNLSQTIASLSSTDGLGSKVLLGSGLLTAGNSGSTVFDGVISGTGGAVALQGGGSMLFTNTNTYTGATTVSGGGTLQLGDGVVKNGSVAGNIGLSNSSAIVFANPSSQLYAGVISGTGSFTKNAPGTLQLTANHTYSGPTFINAGLVQFASPHSTSGFGAPTGSGTANGVAILNGAVVDPTNGTWTLNTYGGYSVSGAMKNTSVTGGSLDLTDGTAADTGPGYKASRSAFYNTPVPVNNSFNVTFTYTPVINLAAAAGYGANYAVGFAFVLQNSASGAKALSGAGRGFGLGNDPEAFPTGTAYNSGAPILNSAAIAYDVFPYSSNPNSGLFSVAPSVLGAGTGFNVNGGTGSSSNNATGSPITGLPVFGGGANTYTPGDPITMAVSYNAMTQVLTWSGTDNGPLNTMGQTTFTETASANLQTITGGPTAYIGFTGADGEFGAAQTISNFNFSTPAPNNILPTTTPLFIAAGGSLDLFGGSQTVGDLSGAGLVTNSFNFTGLVSTLTTGGDNTSQTFSGTLQNGGGTLALTKTGSGGLTLTGPNAFSGPTTVSAGVLYAGAFNTLSSISSVAVNGGTLDVTAAAQTIASLAIGPSGSLNLNVNNLLTSNGTAGFYAGSTLNLSGAAPGFPQEVIAYNALSPSNSAFTTVDYLGIPVPGSDLSYQAFGLFIEGLPSLSTPMWIQGNGNWSMGSNWSTGSQPNAPAATAVLNETNSGAVAISLDVPVTIGMLQFATSTTGYTLSGTNTLTFNNSGSTSSITVVSGTHSINNAVNLQGGSLDIAASNSAILGIGGNISDDLGGRSLILDGDGTGELVLSGTNSYTGSTIVNAGTLLVDSQSALPTGSSLLVGAGASTILSPVVAGPGLSPGVAAVPEPGTLALLLAGLVVGFGAWRGRRKV